LISATSWIPISLPSPRAQERLKRFLDQLRPGGGEEQSLRSCSDTECRIVKQPADALGHLDPAGLSQQPDVETTLGQGFHKPHTERAFPGTVQPFDRYEPSPSHPGQGIWPGGRWH
jgi:hypothetical protein